MNSPNIRLFLSILYFLQSNHTTLNSDKIFMIFDCCIHIMIHRRYMDPKCVLALIFATAFEITSFAKLKTNKFSIYGTSICENVVIIKIYHKP